MSKTAVIDLGSNSIRMSIFADALPLTTLKAYRSTVRLSEGMTNDGLLRAEAQLRAVKALADYKKILDAEGICRVVAVTTAAVRKAKNRKEFLDLVRDTTGISIRVIDGECEAALDSLAVSRILEIPAGIICDIGGGSTELVGISAKKAPAVSIPHGSRGICEMFFSRGETPDAIACAKGFVRDLLAPLDGFDDFKGLPLVGIGGTLRAMAKFDLCDSGGSAIEKHQLDPLRIDGIIRQIESASIEERTHMAGIGKERADIILGGLILLDEVMKRFEPCCVAVADVGVREGVALDVIEGHGLLKINE